MGNDGQDDSLVEFQKLQAETNTMRQSLVMEPTSFLTSLSNHQILKELQIVGEKFTKSVEKEEERDVRDKKIEESIDSMNRKTDGMEEKLKVQDANITIMIAETAETLKELRIVGESVKEAVKNDEEKDTRNKNMEAAIGDLTEKVNEIKGKLDVQDDIRKELEEIRQENEQLAGRINGIEEQQKIQDDVSREILKELQEIRKENAELHRKMNSSADKNEIRELSQKNEELHKGIAEIKMCLTALQSKNVQFRPTDKPIVYEIIGTWRKVSSNEGVNFSKFRRAERHGDMITEWVAEEMQTLDEQPASFYIDVAESLKGNKLIANDHERYIKNGKLYVIHKGCKAVYCKYT